MVGTTLYGYLELNLSLLQEKYVLASQFYLEVKENKTQKNSMDSYVLCLFDQLLMLRMLTFQKVNTFQRNVI